MKKAKLHSFLEIITKAEAIVLIHDAVCELINFNGSITIEKYQNFLEKKSSEAYISYTENLLKISGDSSIYVNSIKLQFKELLAEFIDKNGFLLHRKLSILDPSDFPLTFKDLSNEVKQKISTFISIQKSCLLCFLSKLDQSENHIPASRLKWNNTKTDFVELANVLFEGGIITSETGPISKKEFMQQFGSLLALKVESWEQALNKAMLREKNSHFIDKLKSILTDYSSRNDNIING